MTPDWDAIAERALAQLAPQERDASVVYLDRRVLPAGTTAQLGGREVAIERPSAVAFVDLEPELNWGHRCRYLVLDLDRDAVESVEARMPPFLRGMPATLVVIGR